MLGSIAGHPWTTPAQGFAVVTDAVHVTVAAAWTGGLVALLVMLRGASSRRSLVRRFAAVALVAVVAVVASGLVSAWLQLRTVTALWRTGYGRLLTAKVLAVAAMIGLGWANRRSIERSPPDTHGDATVTEGVPVGSARQLRRLVAAEVALAALVVALTAVLVNRPPGRDEASAPYSADRTTGDLVVQLTVDPARTGANQLHLYFFEAAGLPAAVDAVEVTARVGDVPPRVVPVEPVSPSHFSTYDASLTPGRALADRRHRRPPGPSRHRVLRGAHPMNPTTARHARAPGAHRPQAAAPGRPHTRDRRAGGHRRDRLPGDARNWRTACRRP